jgi:hypothetical protein
MVRDAVTQQNGALDLSEDIVTMWQDFLDLKEEGEVGGHNPLES